MKCGGPVQMAVLRLRSNLRDVGANAQEKEIWRHIRHVVVVPEKINVCLVRRGYTLLEMTISGDKMYWNVKNVTKYKANECNEKRVECFNLNFR
jgi:hypothetical protein